MVHILLFLFVLALASPLALCQPETWHRMLREPTFGFAFNPMNSNTIYVGGLGRVIHKTQDRGRTWTSLPIEFAGGSGRVTNIHVSRLDTNVVIAGGIGLGSVRRSTDGGKTWSIVLERLGPFTMPGLSLIEQPGSPGTLFCADLASRGVYRSTDDGVTWDSLSEINNVPPSATVCALTFHPDSANVILAGLLGGYVSRSNDTGKTWTVARLLVPDGNNDSEVPRIFFAPGYPSRLFAPITYFFPLRGGKRNGGLFESNDGGYTWQQTAFPDTSLWTVTLRKLADGSDEIVAGGYTDALSQKATPTVVGVGLVLSKSGQKPWVQENLSIPWASPIDPLEDNPRNAWLVNFDFGAGDDQRLYLATEDGFYARGRNVISWVESESPNTLTKKLVVDRNKFDLTKLVPYATSATVSIYDASGVCLFRGNTDSIGVTPRLETGLYCLIVLTEKKVEKILVFIL